MPIPHPHISLVLDPMDYIPIIGGTVIVGGVLRGTAGTSGKVIPHIPMGGPFVKPPLNEDEIFMGSATVLADGSPLSFTALPVLSCQDIGMISPIRLKKPKKTYGMVLPTSLVMGIPAGLPVLVGGPPTIDMMSMAMKVGFAALGKALKKLRALQKGSARFKKLSDAVHNRAKKIMDKLGVPPNIRNKVHSAICTVTGHPVDVASGKLFTDAVDFTLPGPIPLKWQRIWFSTSVYQGPLGHGWHHSYDLALMEENGAVAIRLADGRPVAFPSLLNHEVSFNRDERLWLSRDEQGYVLTTAEGLIYYFNLAARRDYRLTSLGHKSVQERIQFFYDADNRLNRIIDCGGRIVYLEYNRFNQLEKIFLPQPQQPDETYCAVQYHYQNNNLVRVHDAFEQPWCYTYNNNILIQETYRNGVSFYFRFDQYTPEGRCIETWGDDGIYYRSITYDVANGITYVKDSLGHIYEYHHNLVVPHKIIDPLKNITLISYNAHSQIFCETDALGYKKLFEYDDFGNTLQITNADGSISSRTYDARQNLIIIEDVVGGKWLFNYNEFNQLINEVDPLGNCTQYTYNGSRLNAVRDAAGNQFFFNYDHYLNLISIRDLRGVEVQWQYDAQGNVLVATDPRGNQRQFTHDILGRLVHINEPDGNVRNLNYDALNNVTLLRDRYYDVELKYQGLGRVAARSQGGVEVKFHYDTEEQLVAIANEHGNVYQFEIDATGEISAERGFDGLMRRYVRDAIGRVHKILRPEQRFSIYSYDAMDRVVEIRHHSGEHERFSYRADSALMAASNAACSLEFERDIFGNVLKEIRDGQYWVASQFNSLGYRTAVQSSQGFAQTIDRDKQGNIKAVHIGDAAQFTTDFARNEWGQELQRTMPGGIKSRWQRDKLGRPTEHVIIGGHTTHSRKTYLWGLDDRLLKIVDSLKRDTQLQHDIFGNLIAAQYNDQPIDLRLPDAVGNLFKTHSRQDREYGPAGQLLSKQDKNGITRYQYDAEGNLIAKQQPDGKLWRYSWNAAGFLHQVMRPDDTLVTFEYDGLGRRISKMHNGKITRWIWDGNNPLHEWVERIKNSLVINIPAHQSEQSAEQQKAVVLQPIQAQAPPHIPEGSYQAPATWVFDPESFAPMGKIVGDAYYPIVTDYLGVPAAMFDPDGQKIWSADITVWGDLNNLKGDRQTCPFRWPGQYEDEETGLYYNRFRYYDPDAGGYVSQDPIRLNSDNANFYAYVSDPYSWIDPLGLAKAKCEVIVRRTNADEAAAMVRRGGLVQKPNSRSAKWVSEGRGQDTLKKKGHEKLVTMEVKPGTIAWLKSKGINFDDVAGEASAPGRVLIKDNEPGALGIGNDLLEEFNSRVTRVTST
ncbi:MAG TPA: DUF6531 domain-containing protein [Cellvibrionaceae bacterium]